MITLAPSPSICLELLLLAVAAPVNEGASVSLMAGCGHLGCSVWLDEASTNSHSIGYSEARADNCSIED